MSVETMLMTGNSLPFVDDPARGHCDSAARNTTLNAQRSTPDASAATPYIHSYLSACGLTEVHDAYPFPAWERWVGSTRYYLLSARRSKIDSLSHPVDIDVLEPVTPAFHQTRNLCRGLPLAEAVRLFVGDALKQLRAES